MKCLAALFLCLFLMPLGWGSSLQTGKRNKVVSFGILEQLTLGKSTKTQIRQQLGEPRTVTDFSKSPRHKDDKDMGVVWDYYEGDHIRLAVSFQPGENTLDSWTWYLYEPDAEKEPKTALLRFPSAKWQSETVKWINPHHYPNECFFTDNAQGVSIEFNRTRNNVSSITRWNPSRKPASSIENEKPPKFCIEDACADAKLSSEVFKDKPLCEIPK